MKDLTHHWHWVAQLCNFLIKALTVRSDIKHMNNSLVPQTLVNNLNFSIERMGKLQRHLQTGKRVVESSDDPAAISINAKLNMSRLGTENVRANLQSAVSFLQVQEGMLTQVGSILSRMSELHTMQSTQFATNGDRENYNKEFKELQGELQDISRAKFNGISLFSDQMPKTLFGDSLDTEIIHPGTHESQSENTMNVTRWGIYRALSDKIQAGDKFPSEFGEKPARDILAFAISDESRHTYFPNNHSTFSKDLDEWKDFIGSDEYNLNGKIGLIRAEEDGNGNEFLPTGVKMPEFAKLFEVLPRDGGTPSDPAKVATGANLLKNAFLDMTENGSKLPTAFGVFVDNTGSLGYNLVDGAVQEFMTWVRTQHPEVTVHPATKNSTNWRDGVYMIDDEQWIKQSLNAVKDMLDDASFPLNPEDGTLDNEKSGVKGLLDDIYNLEDFDMSEMVAFQEKLTEALAVNGAESSRAQSELENLAGKFTNLERAQSRSDDADIAQLMTKFSAAQVKTQLQAQLIKSAEDTYIHLADLL
jgi:flagellin-like hook-associated protein FlgL